MDVDLLFDKIVLYDEPLSEYGREKIIKRIIELKDEILIENPNDKNKELSTLFIEEILSNLSDKDLVVLLILGYEYFAVKFFINLNNNRM